MLHSLFNKLEITTEDFFARIEGWTDSQLAQRPANDEWSANQVIEHLLIAEGGTLGYMKKKTSGGWDTLEEHNMESAAAGKALVSRLSGESKLKAPSVLPEPTNQINNDELKVRWKELRIELDIFLREIKPEYYNKLLFRQPAAGMLNIQDTMRFMIAHVHHHSSQLDRIKASLGI